MRIDLLDSPPHALRQLTTEQLLCLGTSKVVYLKSTTFDGEEVFLICGADGIPLEVVDDIETAVERVTANGFRFVTIH